jgi:hypothetical protein
MQAATWLVENEGPVIKEMVNKHPDYRLVMVGHSLGAGETFYDPSSGLLWHENCYSSRK